MNSLLNGRHAKPLCVLCKQNAGMNLFRLSFMMVLCLPLPPIAIYFPTSLYSSDSS
ncbi:hypothetical protein BDV23DRAFT_165399 [Aspergillus alliaceus]|uniref:Uncharacterized protein n=1 Tax=Petromyces alliaceus TaxID=209559 RepID=A0A5N7BU76_PETAA|nr:hypothetical protein BDV23DRAFT_165399 [Aspergillus alliaceus]